MEGSIGALELQALILAGGFPERMDPISEAVPKCLLPILGRPILEYQLTLLEKAGFQSKSKSAIDPIICST